MADLEMIRRFAGADPDTDPSVLEMCYQSAVEWYAAAGVPATTPGTLYQFWCCNLAAWFFDNRGAEHQTHVPRYIVESVHQLRPKLNRARTAGASASRTAHEMEGSA